MKKLMIITLMILAASSMTAQVATYDEVVSKKTKGKVKTYISKSGHEFNVGDTLKIGTAHRNEFFDFITQNAGIETYPLENTAYGSIVIIKKIKIAMKTTMIYTTKPQGGVFSLLIENIEGALDNGEINLNTITSKEALEELKTWKTKLDLELISQEEYDAQKKRLMEFIK